MRMLALALAVALAFGSAPAHGAACMPVSQWVASLATLGERKIASGFAPHVGFVFEFWVNELTGKWTILRVDANGLACAMTAGEGAVVAAPGVPG